MEVKVEIISREDIRPSSPTPSHLRTFKHSLLDQFVPFPHARIILFYTTSQNLSEFSKRLELFKQSLSEILTQFYPFAGKIKDDLSIDCNDEGANLVVAKVNCPISKLLKKPDLNSLNKFIQTKTTPYFEEETMIGAHVINIQVNVFDCGGIAIGFSFLHRIKPNFATNSLFPTSTLHFRDLSRKTWGSIFRKGKWVTRRFVFKNSAIATLKAQVVAKLKNHPNTPPTRVQIVSALLWRYFMAASKDQFGTQRPSILINTLNLRRRMEESLHPENSIGNFLWLTPLEHMSNSKDDELRLDELVSKLKKSIEQVDKDLVARLQSDEEGSSIIENALRKISGETWSNNKGDEALERLGITSWCNFGVYDFDFGWGKPMWVSTIGFESNSVLMNMLILIDTKFKDGIEAWVTLDEEKMKHLVSNTELLTYATLDPSPLAVSNSRL
ncbi:hypothetical protein AAHE18_16G081100 [Arachis hypogaea]